MPKVILTENSGIVQSPGNGFIVEQDVACNGGVASIRKKVITWDADLTIGRNDSGSIIFCDQQSSAIDLVLPTIASGNAPAAWQIDVYLRTASSAAANIDMGADGNVVFIHLADGGTDSPAGTIQAKRTVSFTANATVNSKYQITSNGINYIVRGFTGTANEMSISDSAP